MGPAASDPPRARNCRDDFFSARTQRSILFSGNDAPRLHTGEAPRQGPVVDVSRVSGPARRGAPFVGYMGPLRVEYGADERTVAADMADLRGAGARRFDPDQTVRIDLNKVTIDYMLRQLLGGALGVNYIAPDDLAGSVTFRTEEPIPKAQVLHVVRDILGRNGLIIKLVNGVYHVGRPELINSMESSSRAGQANELVTRVVRVPKGNAAELIGFVRQLVPDTVTLLPSNAPGTIIVRAPPGDINQVEGMLKSLSGSAIGDDRVAVIPLTQAAPERIATQLTEFYRSRLPPGGGVPTILPLERQQALLVGTSNSAIMAGLRGLVQQLDRESADEPTLRVIALKHLNAEEIVQQLSGIFGNQAQANRGGGGVGGGGLGAAAGRGAAAAPRGRGESLPPLFPPGQLTPPGSGRGPLADDDAGAGEAAPGFSAPRSAGSDLGAATGQPSAREVPRAVTSPGTASPVAAGGGVEANVRIVADTRTNTVLVYSSFATFRRIRDVILALDVAQSQVVIEATVIEVDLNDQLDSGVQFFLNGGNNFQARSSVDTTATDAGRPGGFIRIGGQIGSVRAEAVLQALQAVTKVKVISSPYLTVLDGKAARLVIGDQIPFAVRSQTSQNTGNVTVTTETEIRDTGIILEVTPRVKSDNSVALKIKQSVSTPSDSVRAGNTQPIIATRNVESDVLAQSGRTVLLGGLIQDRIDKTDTGVPVLRTTPVIGDLFQTRTDRVRRVELIVMITPRVVRQSSQIEDISRLIRTQLHTRPDASSLTGAGPAPRLPD